MKPFWPRSFDLHPAHLQARDAYLEQLVAQRTKALTPHAYASPCTHGFVDLQIDVDALTEGDLVLEGVRAVFPSGAFFDAAEAEAAPIRRHVGNLIPRGAAGGVELFLALPKLVERAPNVSANDGISRSVRFLAQGDDETPWAQLQPEIVAQSEPLERFETLSLGRLVHSGRHVELVSDNLPTLFRVRAAPILLADLAQFITDLQGRTRELLQERLDHPFSIATATNAQWLAVELLAILQGSIPLLHELATRVSTPPRELYAVLLELYGRMAVFGASDAPPAYDHEALGPIFRWLFQRIGELVKTAARDETPVLRFVSTGNGYYDCSFAPKAVAARRVFLVIRGLDPDFVRAHMSPLFKLATPERIKDLTADAIRGVSFKVEIQPPPTVPNRPDVVCFRLHEGDPLWREIEAGGRARLFAPQFALENGGHTAHYFQASLYCPDWDF